MSSRESIEVYERKGMTFQKYLMTGEKTMADVSLIKTIKGLNQSLKTSYLKQVFLRNGSITLKKQVLLM